MTGYCGSAIVVSFDPVFRRSVLMYPYPPSELFHLWIGIAGMGEARGWAAGFDIPPEFTVVEYESLQQVCQIGGVQPLEWVVEFSECLEILPGEVLPVARITLTSGQELPDSYRFETIPYGTGNPPAWFDCQNTETAVRRSGIAEITGPIAGGAVQPVAAPEATPPLGSIPLNVAFQANAYDTDGPQEELLFYWLFGDGLYSVEANPQHEYVEPGDYSVWLNVFDGVSDVNNFVIVNVTPSSIGSIPDPARQQQLLRPSPNPFNPQTELSFELEQDTRVRLTVYDMAGHRIATLLDEFMSAGRQTVRWGGTDSGGRAVPSGSYLVRLVTNQGVSNQKILLAK